MVRRPLILAIWFLFLVFGLTVHGTEPGTSPCDTLWTKLSSTEIQEVKGLLSHRVEIANNGVFIESLLAQSRKDRLFYYHVENAVLKALNDIYFRDKELSAGITSWYKRNLMEIFKSFVSSEPRLVYADYKGIRLGFEEPSELLMAQLSGLHYAAGLQFAGQMERYPELGVLFSANHGLVSNPRAWFLAGVGFSPDRAALAARVARFQSNAEGEVPPVQDYDNPEVHRDLGKRLTVAEDHRLLLTGRMEATQSGEFPMVSPTNRANISVPTPYLLDTLRKVEARTRKEYLEEVRGRIARRFQVVLTDQEIETFQKYYHVVETFSPSVLEDHEIVDMGLGRATHGMVAVDINGQGNRNLHRTQIALARTAGIEVDPVSLAVSYAREEQTQASMEFEARRRAVNEVFQSAFPLWNRKMDFSGDDGVFLPPARLSSAQKQKVLDGLAGLGEPGSYRMSFIPQEYADTGQPILVGGAAQLVTFSENYEKALRKDLERSGISYWQLRSVLFGVDLLPSARGNHRIRLLIGGALPPEMKKKVQRSAQNALPPATYLEPVQ